MQTSRIELLEDVIMKAMNCTNRIDYPKEQMLMFKLIGTKAYALEQTQLVKKIVERHHASNFVYAETPEKKMEFWKIRKEPFYCP